MHNKIQIYLLDKNEKLPYDLLLLADETIDAINKYVFDSDVYVAKLNNEIIGVFCLYKINEITVEIKNIAVAEKYQGCGFGSFLLQEIKKIVKSNCKNLILGTPDIASRQINFYEKNKFVIFDVRKNFFVTNYSKPIFENGIQLIIKV